MCTEHGLQKPPGASTNPLDEQMRRRIFWMCYIMDRYSSTTLNRPFAIPDRDIQVCLPADIDDHDTTIAIGATLTLDTLCANRASSHFTEMSVFRLCIRLRQISSRIHYEFSRLLKLNTTTQGNGESFMLSGKISTTLRSIIQDLEDWRRSAPVFQNPRCLFETQDWYDLQQARETLHAVRKAVDLSPKRNGIPSRDISSLCLNSAIRVILLYSDLYRQSKVTYTRSYFQMMFTAGLSILYCMSILPDLVPSAEKSRTALVCCEETLAQMATQLPDAKHYVTIFEALHQRISQRLSHLLQNPLTTDSANVWSGVNTFTQQTRQSVSCELPPIPQIQPFADTAMYNQGLSFNQLATDGRTYQPNINDGGFSYDSLEANFSAFQRELLITHDSLHWALLSDDALWDVGNFVIGDSSEITGVFSGYGLPT